MLSQNWKRWHHQHEGLRRSSYILMSHVWQHPLNIEYHMMFIAARIMLQMYAQLCRKQGTHGFYSCLSNMIHTIENLTEKHQHYKKISICSSFPAKYAVQNSGASFFKIHTYFRGKQAPPSAAVKQIHIIIWYEHFILLPIYFVIN